MIVTCPVCFQAEDVTWQRLPDRMVRYTCTNKYHGGHHVWLTSLDQVMVRDEADEGVTDELLDPLSACVIAGEPFVEYGIVEHRFRDRFPDLFAAHVRDRGHAMFGSGLATASSVRFGVALGRLEHRGELTSRYGPATGAWRYNDRVTYWAKVPGQTTELRSWSTYCAAIGRSPDWTDADRHGLHPPQR